MSTGTLAPELKTLLDDLKQSGLSIQQKVDTVLAWGAEKGKLTMCEKAIIQLEADVKAVNAGFDQKMAQVKREAWTRDGSYRGVFSSEEQARGFGLYFMAHLAGEPNAKAKAAWDSEFKHMVLDKKDMATNPDSSGGALIPPEFTARIIRLVEQYGVFQSEAFSMPMSTDRIIFIRQNGEVTVFLVGESIAPTESDLAVSNIELTAKEWGTLTFYPRSLEEDAAAPLAEMIARSIAYAFALKMDLIGFTGDGTKTSFGIMGISPGLLKINTVAPSAGGGLILASDALWKNLVIDDFTNVQGALPNYAAQGGADSTGDVGTAKWFCSRNFFFGVMVKVALKSGGVTAGEVQGRRQLLWGGDPVRLTQVLPRTTAVSQIPVLYGDISKSSTVGSRSMLKVESSTQYKFPQRQVVVLGTQRVAINNHELGTATAAGPVVGLITKAS